MYYNHCQCLSSFALRLIVVAEHTVQYLVDRSPTNVPVSHHILALLTADNDPPFGHSSEAFPLHFPINARKTQEGLRQKSLINIACPTREAKNFCEYWTTVS